jgi:uncharacterized protein (DUF2236 family)
LDGDRVSTRRDVAVAHGGLTLRRCPADDRAVTIVTREQLEASLSDLCAQVDDPRAGIFGPRSLAWRLGGDLGVFLGGGRAALLQLAHPMVAHAIDHHSRTRTDIAGRFQRTFRNVFMMVFGPLDEAVRSARRVHAIHARISGRFAEAVGGWPAGTRYHANDAEALRWVHATLTDTTLLVRDRLDGVMPLAIKDRYVVELNRFAALFGIPRELLPASWADHARYMEHMLSSDQIAVTPAAREMARFLVGRGGAAQPPLGRITEAVTAALMPPHLVRAFGLRGSPALVRAGLASFRALYARLPASMVTIPARSDAIRRVQGRAPRRWSAWTERQLFGLAQRATGA